LLVVAGEADFYRAGWVVKKKIAVVAQEELRGLLILGPCGGTDEQAGGHPMYRPPLTSNVWPVM